MSDTPRPPDFPSFEDGADDPDGFAAPQPGAEGFAPVGRPDSDPSADELPLEELEPRPFSASEFDLPALGPDGFGPDGFGPDGFGPDGFGPAELTAAEASFPDAASPEPNGERSDPLSPDPLSPDPLSPDPLSPDPLSPDPLSSDPASPEGLADEADAVPEEDAPPVLDASAFVFAEDAEDAAPPWTSSADWPLFAEEADVSLVLPGFDLPAVSPGPAPVGPGASETPTSAAEPLLGSESVAPLYDTLATPDAESAFAEGFMAPAFGASASGASASGAPERPAFGAAGLGMPAFDATAFDATAFDATAEPPALAGTPFPPVLKAPHVEGAARPFDPYAPASGAAFDPLNESFGPTSSPYDEAYDEAYEPLIGVSHDDRAETEPGSGGDGAPDGAPEPGASAGAMPLAPARRGKGKRQSHLALGVHVLPQAVLGVLVRVSDGRYEPLRHLVRNRTAGTAPSDAYDPTSFATPAEVGAMSGSDDGVTVSFGSGPTVDLEAEFAGLSAPAEGSIDPALSGGTREEAPRLPIVFELRDMLEECAAAGYDRPSLAFAIGPPDVAYAEVVVPAEKKMRPGGGKKKGKARESAQRAQAPTGAVRREKLLGLLPKEDVARSEKDRITFLPMTPRDGERRYLAVLPQPAETVAESLDMLREQSRYRRLLYQTIEAEVPLLMGMVRLVCPAEPHENTAFVRVGAEDTLVLLFTGNELHHYELLQSVSVFDGPDTVCSRVLLQQDVQGIGTVHNVIVMSEERERDLVQGFAAFYPEARVETLRDGMARVGVAGDLPASHVEAAAAALAGTVPHEGLFEESHLLPKHLRGKHRRIELALAWHTLVAAMLLFLSVVFFVGLYISNASEIAEAERRLAEFPAEAHLTVPQLQTRIDSLRQAQVEMTASLAAMDSLLFGTDLWTQTLLRTTRAASATGGIWIEDWVPGGAELTIHGFATSRARVVSLAQRLSATIQEVSFRDLREYPVYEYRMTMALPNELPQVARFLREQAGEPVPAAPVEALAGIDPTTGLPTAPAPTRPVAPATSAPVAPAPAAPAPDASASGL